MAWRVDSNRFDELVEEALAELPDPFARRVDEVSLEVMPRPTAAQLKMAGVGSRGLLLGLYHGRPLTVRSVEESGRLPDVIYIFQEPIERVCDSEDDIRRQVRTTVLHEIGHHFGMSEKDLDDLGYG